MVVVGMIGGKKNYTAKMGKNYVALKIGFENG